MTREERQRIISEEYIDLIIEYGANLELLERFRAYGVNILDARYAVVQFPIELVNPELVLGLGYASLPHCYGLTSTINLESSGVLKVRNQPFLNLRGQGVLIGIIDTGIDYTNPIFRYSDGSSRIMAIWDQSIDSFDNYPEGYFYGTEYSKIQIDEALSWDNPYEFVPSYDEVGHGTALAGVAAGCESPRNDFSGVVPDANFVIVKLKPAKNNIKDILVIPEDAVCYQENDIMFATRYVVEIARKLSRPVSVCIGLGSSQGSHDGTGPLSQYITLKGRTRGVSITVSAGNEGNGRRHFHGIINPGIGFVDVELNVGNDEKGFTMELWGDIPSIYSINILSPTGEFIPRIPPRLNEFREITFIMESTVIMVSYSIVETSTGDQLIAVRFINPSSGIWRFRVFKTGDLTVGFHIWLPMEHFISPDTFFLRSDPDTTILNPGNVVVPITVTAYNPITESLYVNSSRGFSRLGEEITVPDGAAPGVDITIPTLAQGFGLGTGTGLAAAQAAGMAAMILEWGIVKGNYSRMNSVTVKKLMIRGARRRPNMEYPNEDWGYGIIDIFNVFDVLRRDTLED